MPIVNVGGCKIFSTISRAYQRGRNGPKLFAMLESYFDDSSDRDRERYYACGGLMGLRENWDWFCGRWCYERKAAGLSDDEPFRATDCECGHGVFKDWPKEKRDSLMATLVSLVRDMQLYGFAAIIPIDLYKKYFPMGTGHQAFLIVAQQAIMNMAFIANNKPTPDDITVWFEDGPRTSGVKSRYDAVKQSSWPSARRLYGLTFADKKCLPLQSADLVAREAFKHIENFGERPTRIPIRRLNDRLCFLMWTEEALVYLAENGGPDNIELLSTWEESSDRPRFRRFWRNF